MSDHTNDFLEKLKEILSNNKDIFTEISIHSNLSIETQIFNNLHKEFSRSLDFSEENYSKLELELVKFIKNNPVIDLTPFEELGPYDGIINTDFGTAILSLISLNISRSKNIDEFKGRKIRWNTPSKELFNYFLKTEPKNQEFLLIFGLQFYNIGFLDTEWLISNLDLLFRGMTDEDFEKFFGGYLYQIDSIALISINEFKKRGLFSKYLTLEKKYPHNRCLKGFAWHTILDSFNGGSELLETIFEEEKIEYIDSIIIEMWNLRKEYIGSETANPYLTRQKEIVSLWDKIVKKSQENTIFFEAILGKISIWIELIQDLNTKTVDLIVSTYAFQRSNKYFLGKFYEGLLASNKESIERRKLDIFFTKLFEGLSPTDSLNLLMWIMRKKEISLIDLVCLNILTENTTKRKYFFTHLDQPEWFQSLLDFGFLSLKKSLPYDFWFELYYLKEVKKDLQNSTNKPGLLKKFTEFLSSILDIRPIPEVFQKNPHSVSSLIELIAWDILEDLNEKLKLFLIKLQEINASSLFQIEYQLIQYIIPVLIEHNDSEMLEFLLGFLLQFKMNQYGEKPYIIKNFKPIFDGYAVSNILAEQMPELVKILGMKTFNLYLKKIKEISNFSEYSFSARLSLHLEESSPRPLDGGDYEELLIIHLEEYIANEQEVHLNKLIEDLLEDFSYLEALLIIFILLSRKNATKLNFESLIVHDQNFLNEYNNRYPNFRFLKEYGKKFSSPTQKVLLEKINDLRFEEFKENEFYEAFIRRQKIQFLQPLASLEHPISDIVSEIERLEKEEGRKVPEMKSRISGFVTVGGPNADLQKIKEFETMSLPEIRDVLEKLPPEEHHWNRYSTPLAFQQDIVRFPKKYLSKCSELIGFRNDLMINIISGFSELLKIGDVNENIKILEFFVALLTETEKEEYLDQYSHHIIYSLHFDLDPNKFQFSENTINIFLELLDILFKITNFIPFTKVTTSIIFSNSSFYRFFELYLSISQLNMEREKEIIYLQEKKFNKILRENDHPCTLNVCAYISWHLPYYWNISRDWISKQWDILFNSNWQISFPEYIKFGMRGPNPELFEMLDRSQIPYKIINSINQFDSDNEFVNNFGRFLMIKWFNEKFSLESKNLIEVSIESSNLPLIHALIKEILLLWKKFPSESKPLIDYCWPKFIQAGNDKKLDEKSSILNRLIRWFEIIPDLNKNCFDKVKKSVVECNNDFSLRKILEYLQRNVANEPEMVADLLMSLPITKNLYYFSKKEEYAPILTYLIDNGHKLLARNIIDHYAENDLIFLWEEYREKI